MTNPLYPFSDHDGLEGDVEYARFIDDSDEMFEEEGDEDE